MKAHSRDCNLDLLRAAAIVAVVFYHFVQLWPIDYAGLKPFSGLGKYGVTLFFVLSGWLIGGIFWREQLAAGRVQLGDFWIRRWLRTVPPYLVGMTLAYSDVWFGRGDAFDYRYLLFLQNYAETIPFYLISWSLCAEEHFYLLLPLVGMLCARLPVANAAVVVWSLPVLPPLLRLVDPNVNASAPFGYSHTATHLISEGLALGVAAAFTRCYYPQRWAAMQKVAGYLAVPALGLFLTIAWWNEPAEYYIGQSVIAACSLVWLAAVVERQPVLFASSQPVYWIAIASYSIYLTHCRAMQQAARFAFPTDSPVSQWLALIYWLAVISVMAFAFYLFVERPAIHLRNYVSRWLSRRRQSVPAAPATASATASATEPVTAPVSRLVAEPEGAVRL